ncbi:MAG: OmpH family outer membrane protein [Bryobacterales bacterium]|nr:OmpH family outer membrane protein [Bryobacterales bacterium]
MRQFVKTTLLSACALVAFGGIALTAQQKVAIIDVQRAILETSQIKKAQADLEAKYKPRQDEFDAAQKEMASIQNQLDTQAATLTPVQAADLQGKLQLAQRRVQRMQEDLQASVGRDRDAVLGQVGQRMQEVVTKIASEKDLDVLIDVSNAVYFKPALDITTEAVTAYDKAHPAT